MKAISWSPSIGLDDVVVGNGKFTLLDISKDYGVSIFHLESLTGIKRSDLIPDGFEVRFNRPERWLTIAKWFSDWETWIKGIPDLTRIEKSRMFITRQLHGDLQRTCHSMYDIIHCYVNRNVERRWIPKRFSQDTVESFFSEVRQSGGGNTDSDRQSVENTISSRRFKQMYMNS